MLTSFQKAAVNGQAKRCGFTVTAMYDGVITVEKETRIWSFFSYYEAMTRLAGHKFTQYTDTDRYIGFTLEGAY